MNDDLLEEDLLEEELRAATEELRSVPEEDTPSATCNDSEPDYVSNFIEQNLDFLEQNSEYLKERIKLIKELMNAEKHEEVKIILDHLRSEIDAPMDDDSPQLDQTTGRAVAQRIIHGLAREIAQGSPTRRTIGLYAIRGLAACNFVLAIMRLYEEVPEFFEKLAAADCDIEGLLKAVFSLYSITLTALPYIQSAARYIKYRRQCRRPATQPEINELPPLDEPKPVDNNVKDLLEQEAALSPNQSIVCFRALYDNKCFHRVLEIFEVGLVVFNVHANYHLGWGRIPDGRHGWGETLLTHRAPEHFLSRIQLHCVRFGAASIGFLCEKLGRARAVGVATSAHAARAAAAAARLTVGTVAWWREQKRKLDASSNKEKEPLLRRNPSSNIGGNNIRRRKNTIYYKRKNRQPKRRVTRKINNRPKTKKNRKKFKK